MPELKKDMKSDLVYNMQKIYLEIYKISNSYLEDYYGSYQKPYIIDIRNIVKKYGIDIVEKEIHSHNFFFTDQISGYLDTVKNINDIQYVIYVDKNLNEPYKRYVIAHEFSHYILGIQEKEEQSIRYCSNVLFPKNLEENACDIMTSFLLMPIENVVLLMKQFIKNKKNDYPIHISEWLWCLSYWTQLSNYHGNLCFSHIRYLAAFIYDKQSKEPNDVIPITNIKEYENLFF